MRAPTHERPGDHPLNSAAARLPVRMPRVMAILNLTPDSFSDGGACFRAGGVDVEAALARARACVTAGADALDLGGESTRPGSQPVSVDEELARVLPVLDALRSNCPVPISIDTRRALVAAAAHARGATILNDTSALCDDPELAAVAAERRMQVVLMHRQGVPATMQQAPRYDDVVAEVRAFLEERVAAACAAGIAEERLILDPGLGFGKRLEDNTRLLAALPRLRIRALPLLVGASRKSFLDRLPGVALRPAAERLPGSLACAAVAALQGAEWVRVHDVEATVEFLRTLTAIAAEEQPG